MQVHVNLYVCVCIDMHMNDKCQSAKSRRWVQHVSSGSGVKGDCEGANHHMVE